MTLANIWLHQRETQADSPGLSQQTLTISDCEHEKQICKRGKQPHCCGHVAMQLGNGGLLRWGLDGLGSMGRYGKPIKCLNLRLYILMGKWNNFEAARQQARPFNSILYAVHLYRPLRLHMQIKRAFNNLRCIHLGAAMQRPIKSLNKTFVVACQRCCCCRNTLKTWRICCKGVALFCALTPLNHS